MNQPLEIYVQGRAELLSTKEYFEKTIYMRGFCKTLERKKKLSFRASEARPGIQDFQAILDSGFRRNDG